VIKISFGCTRDFCVKIWGTSSPEDKLAGGLGNVIEATSTGGRWSDFFTAEKLAAGNLGLLQQYQHLADIDQCDGMSAADESGLRAPDVAPIARVPLGRRATSRRLALGLRRGGVIRARGGCQHSHARFLCSGQVHHVGEPTIRKADAVHAGPASVWNDTGGRFFTPSSRLILLANFARCYGGV
jgi:hypothetical protein